VTRPEEVERRSVEQEMPLAAVPEIHRKRRGFFDLEELFLPRKIARLDERRMTSELVS
jgi:hypothetical protein